MKVSTWKKWDEFPTHLGPGNGPAISTKSCKSQCLISAGENDGDAVENATIPKCPQMPFSNGCGVVSPAAAITCSGGISRGTCPLLWWIGKRDPDTEYPYLKKVSFKEKEYNDHTDRISLKFLLVETFFHQQKVSERNWSKFVEDRGDTENFAVRWIERGQHFFSSLYMLKRISIKLYKGKILTNLLLLEHTPNLLFRHRKMKCKCCSHHEYCWATTKFTSMQNKPLFKMIHLRICMPSNRFEVSRRRS